MSKLTSGKEWLSKLETALTNVVTFMALRRYGRIPDVDDRVGDALAALVEGADRFKPQPGRDGVGYFLQYALSYVAGALRNGASVAKGWGDEAVTFSDLAPTALGIERVWETLPGTSDEEPGETQFVLNNGKVASTLEIIELITGHDDRRRIAAKHLGIQADDEALPVRLLQALDGLASHFTADGRWIVEPSQPTSVVTHDLAPTTVIRNGVQTEMSAANMREAVEAASKGTVPWVLEQCNVQYEEREEGPDFYPDESVWPKKVDRRLWLELLGVWAWVECPGVVLDALAGEDISPSSAEAAAIELMDTLAVALADEADGSCRRVAGALAFRVKAQHDAVDKQALYEAFCEFFGVDGSGAWDAEMPSAGALQPRVAAWIDKVAAHKGVWPSQAAAITALVLKGASPREAKAASQRAYHSRQPQATYAEASV